MFSISAEMRKFQAAGSWEGAGGIAVRVLTVAPSGQQERLGGERVTGCFLPVPPRLSVG